MPVRGSFFEGRDLDQAPSWTSIAQVVIGAMATGACGTVGYLFRIVMDLREAHAALAARVDEHKKSTATAIEDMKDSLCAINEKLDRLIERRP